MKWEDSFNTSRRRLLHMLLRAAGAIAAADTLFARQFAKVATPMERGARRFVETLFFLVFILVMCGPARAQSGVIATTTTLSSSLNPSHYGQTITLTAALSYSGSGTATGSVTFYDGTTALGSVALSNDAAAFSTSALTAGSHSLTASYSGDRNFGPSTSAVLVQVVAKSGVTITLTSSPNPSYVDQSVTFSVVVSGSGAIPTGTVVLEEGKKVLGTASLVSGQASFTTSFAKAGSASIIASYSGDQNYLAKNSSALKQVVDKYSTSTALTSSPNPSASGQPVTLTATVSSTGPIPTGKVTFKNQLTSLGSGNLINGVAALTRSNLPCGTLSITAIYGGDTASEKSTSPVLRQVVCANEWTWVDGANVINQAGTYGTEGTPAPSNVPGARDSAVSWKDAAGNFWLLGGEGYDSAGTYTLLNDLWEYSGGEWTWTSGSKVGDQYGDVRN